MEPYEATGLVDSGPIVSVTAPPDTFQNLLAQEKQYEQTGPKQDYSQLLGERSQQPNQDRDQHHYCEQIQARESHGGTIQEPRQSSESIAASNDASGPRPFAYSPAKQLSTVKSPPSPPRKSVADKVDKVLK